MRVTTSSAAASPRRPGRATSAVLITVVFLSAIGSAMSVGVSPASAHGTGSNGCTGVPDSGYGFEFRATCDGHDRCYRSQPYGSGYGARSLCDRIFRTQMLRYCERHPTYSLVRAGCRSTARAYYYGVRLIGYPFWALRMPTPIG